jgi:hypothetical protein
MKTCWNIQAKDFPVDGTAETQLRFALQYAILAPSSHNSQPWRFFQNNTGVTFIADRTRGLSVVDPYDRELIIGCGAAIMNLCVALSHFGLGFDLHAFPAQAESDVLAMLHLHAGQSVPALAELFPAICERVTNRGTFDSTPIPDRDVELLRTEAAAEGVSLTALRSDQDLLAIADLIVEADQEQLSDHRFRRERASWIHPSRTHDGIPGHSRAVSALVDFARPLTSMIGGAFECVDRIPARDATLALGSPLILCFHTVGDTQEDWLFAGQALGRVLLRAKLLGMDASFLNQPIQIPAFRERLTRIIGVRDTPQLLIRMGRGASLEHTPRRPIGEIVD